MRFKLFSASLLIAGTTIGAGMLALPVSTAQSGFIPASFLFVLCYLFMAATGLLIVEACLWLPKDANIISLSSHLLGRGGKIASWLLYLFLFYCLTIAYIAGGGGFISSISHGALSNPMAIGVFTLAFSPFVYMGTKAVDRMNFLLMLGLIVTYFTFLIFGMPHIQMEYLAKSEWSVALTALPIVFASFSYQGIIPSIVTYLNRDARLIKKAIWIGTSIPLIIYMLWELLILGIVPFDDPHGLLEAKKQGLTAVAPLKHFLNVPIIYQIGQAFAFFALTTSFLGVTLGLMDFFADGLKVKKTVMNKLWLYLLVFLPPVLIAVFNPHIFLTALSYAGGIGCALLLGLFPVLMIWQGRYVKGLRSTTHKLKGGKPLLILMALFVICEVVLDLIQEFFS